MTYNDLVAALTENLNVEAENLNTDFYGLLFTDFCNDDLNSETVGVERNESGEVKLYICDGNGNSCNLPLNIEGINEAVKFFNTGETKCEMCVA